MKGITNIGIIACITMIFGVVSCASMSNIKVARGNVTDPRAGSYTVLLYTEGDGPHDPRWVGLLDLEGDAYDLSPWGAAFKTSRFEGMKVEDATEMAIAHVEKLFNVSSVEIKEISAPDGTFVGYEFRPVFQPFATGDTDLLLVSYVFKPDKSVKVYIDLHPRVEPFYRIGSNDRRIP